MAPRARDFFVFAGTPGPLNSIADIGGLEVGMVSICRGDGELVVGQGPVRTGVTAILPRGKGEEFSRPCAAGFSSFNGNGEMTGTHWIRETGSLAGPVLISNTHAIGPCHQGVIDYHAKHHRGTSWLLPVVAETWDGYLNDTATGSGGHVTPQDAMEAIESSVPNANVQEGSAGGGFGMNCYGFKGGNGTASRVVALSGQTYTVSSFLQCNFGRRGELTLQGVPLGQLMTEVPNPLEDGDWHERDLKRALASNAAGAKVPGGSGSVIAIIATDAPLLPGQCEALARRVPLGLARTGTTGSHFSGDIFLAFSTAIQSKGALSSGFSTGDPDEGKLQELKFVPWDKMNPLYEAVVQCVEESIINALVANTADFVGRDGHVSPHFRVELALAKIREWRVPLNM
ncbi:peptidase S58, DmpA [Hyaloraphidium curvatum]|nr:peptidase S58, DmpA [Hyaloraphidium curvatum]